VGGFLQRCDEVRKYAFGMMAVLGDAAPYEIMGVWLIRGKSMGPMLEANPDAEYYDWKEVNLEDAAARKHVADVWCHVYPGTLMNKPIYDSKVRTARLSRRPPLAPPSTALTTRPHALPPLSFPQRTPYELVAPALAARGEARLGGGQQRQRRQRQPALRAPHRAHDRRSAL
jgi:hypothetical protein